MSTTVLIVDDSLTIRRSLRSWFEQRTDWEVCGEAENGAIAVERVKALKADSNSRPLDADQKWS